MSSSPAQAPIVLSHDAIVELADLVPDAFDAVADGFVRLARGDVRQPPVLSLDLPEVRGELDVKTAWVNGWERFCVKLSTGFFSNPALGLPSGSGLMVVLSASTGRPDAVLLDDGYLTDLRTAIAGGLAARSLARPDATVAAIVGAGTQARWQARALAAVRPLREVRIWARRHDAAAACAHDVQRATGVSTRAVPDLVDAVRGAHVVVTTTASRRPLVPATVLEPGMHVTAMGSDGAGKRELDPGLLRSVDRIIVDDLAQSRSLGELQGFDTAPGREPLALGTILAGDAPGRQGEHETTACDLTGTGVQDTAISNWVLERHQATRS